MQSKNDCRLTQKFHKTHDEMTEIFRCYKLPVNKANFCAVILWNSKWNNSTPCNVQYIAYGAIWWIRYTIVSLSCRTLLVYVTRMRRTRKIGEDVSCTARTSQGNCFKLILMVKMKTRHPVEGSFASEFPVICHHCEVMAAWSRKTFTFREKFLRFFLEKRPLAVKISKLCSESFHCLTYRRCCV